MTPRFFCVFLSLVTCIFALEAKYLERECTVDAFVQAERGDSQVSLAHYNSRLRSLTEFAENLNLIVRNSRGAQFSLSLARNRQLVAHTAKSDASQHGDTSLCHYSGSIAASSPSHAAVNLCPNHFSAMIWSQGNHWVLQSNPESGQFRLLRIRYSSENGNSAFCDKTLMNFLFSSTKTKRPKRRAKRSVSPYDDFLDGKQRYVELALVADHLVYEQHNRDSREVRTWLLSIVNVINAIYYPINIRMALVHLEIWSEGDKANVTSSLVETLRTFAKYRAEQILPRVPHDNAQLLSGVVTSNGVVGRAHLGTMCSIINSVGVSIVSAADYRSRRHWASLQDHHSDVAQVASTVAHEMGHNFGMDHDGVECECDAYACLMRPSSSDSTYWSTCSLVDLQKSLSLGMDFCLLNEPAFRLEGSSCGNGYVEPGEQCDCGDPDTCWNDCCNATTCTLVGAAECASGACCDTRTCTVKPAAKKCRAAADECDLPEFCDGQSEHCPDDFFQRDVNPCDNGQAFCVNGKCGSRETRCHEIWGVESTPSDAACYELNTKGDLLGNCGYDVATQTYPACAPQQIECGRLHCAHESDPLRFPHEQVVRQAYTKHWHPPTYKEYSMCWVAHLASLPDKGMVPDGAPCTAGRNTPGMCQRQRCVAVGSSSRSSKQCAPADCGGKGVCNNNGHCHCEKGRAGDDCSAAGPGGSVDSGPASGDSSIVLKAVALVVCALVSLIAIAAVVWLVKGKRWQRIVEKLLELTKLPPKPAPLSRRVDSIRPVITGPVRLSTRDEYPPPRPTSIAFSRSSSEQHYSTQQSPALVPPARLSPTQRPGSQMLDGRMLRNLVFDKDDHAYTPAAASPLAAIPRSRLAATPKSPPPRPPPPQSLPSSPASPVAPLRPAWPPPPPDRARTPKSPLPPPLPLKPAKPLAAAAAVPSAPTGAQSPISARPPPLPSKPAKPSLPAAAKPLPQLPAHKIDESVPTVGGERSERPPTGRAAVLPPTWAVNGGALKPPRSAATTTSTVPAQPAVNNIIARFNNG